MLDHHTKGLASVRAFSIDHRTCVHKEHVCLREASAKKFFHASSSEALCWSRVASLEAPHNPHLPPAGESRCSHCRSKEIHSCLGLVPSRGHCPFAGLKINSLALKKALKQQSVDLLAAHPDLEAAKASIAEFARLALATP